MSQGGCAELGATWRPTDLVRTHFHIERESCKACFATAASKRVAVVAIRPFVSESGLVGRERGGDDIEPIEDISDPSQELFAAHPARGAVLIGGPFAGIE